MQDLSFIRLEPNFQDAKYTGASNMASIFFFGQICLSPDETYLQTTNTPSGIAFDGNYEVTIVDCNDVELQDITNNVAINERTINGLPQIDFEIVNIGSDYYAKTVFLKFKHTVSNYVWYSNPLNITNYFINETSRFDYKNATDSFYQSIRLKTYFTVNDAESQSSEYVTYDGKKLTSRLITTEIEKYIFDKIDNFTYRRLNNLLSRNIIYLNGNRVTDKQTLPSKDRAGDSNIFNIDFKVAIDYNETYTEVLQIFEQLALVDQTPLGFYSSFIPTEIIGSFNRNITLGVGTLTIYKDNVLFATYNQGDIAVVDNEFTIDILGLLVDNGDYYINFTSGLFTDALGNTIAITNDTDWAFSLIDGEFSATDFDNTEFLTT
jgi:hypothetical protein